MYFINDEAGEAYETYEGGLFKFNSKDGDFSDSLSKSERERAYSGEWRQVSEEEAFAFARSKVTRGGEA